MSKYNRYAKDLDTAFRAAREEYAEAWKKLQEADEARGKGDAMQRQRAELKYQQAQLDFKEAEARIWPDFNHRRAELRRELVAQVTADGAANPDTVDPNGLELLKSGIMSPSDFFSLEEKYSGNPTMLRILGKYAREAANDKEKDQVTRGALYELADRCAAGYGPVVAKWDKISQTADYCSGQARQRRDTPRHTVSMGAYWEQLAGDDVETF